LNLNIEHIKDTLSKYERQVISDIEPDVIRASVLIPLLLLNGTIHVLLTMRTHDVQTHKGQISFPGGVNEPSDTSLIETALRETEEEIGIPKSTIEVLGGLDDLLTPFKFCITPIVGYIAEQPTVYPNPSEVAEVFYVPISFFTDPSNGWQEERTRNGKTFPVWLFQYKQYLIWGATAGILKKFVDLLTIQNEKL